MHVFPSKTDKKDPDCLFSRRLRQARKKIGQSQHQVSRAIGVSKTTLCFYEAGMTFPDVRTFYKMCQYFGVSYDYFFKEDYQDEA